MKPIEEMTYKEFQEYTEDRACDGRWDLLTAVACIDMRKRIDAVKVRGLFKRKATERKQEEEWQKLLAEIKKGADKDGKVVQHV